MKPNWQQPKLGHSFFGAHLPLRRALNLAILAIIYPVTLLANPDGAQIINGQVSIDNSTPGVTNITNSPNAIIHWQNFNIAQNEITRFIQQNSQSAVLNRIIGENPSAILGQLASNGKVFLINPNGIVFGAGAVVDTQGMVASSLNLSDQDFLRGNYHFIAGSKAGNIVNEGIIRAGKDGSIILIAPSIKNNGIIKSEGGQITLAAGQELVLTNLDDPDIRFEIQAPGNAVLNLGKLLTAGGAVNVFADTIKHSGEINADSVEVDAQGNIKLLAQQSLQLTQSSQVSANNSHGDAGTVVVESKAGTTLVDGTIEAEATQAGKGGNIAVLGERVAVLNNSRINADGGNAGGRILVGGDTQGKNAVIHNAKATYIGADTQITADAKNKGNGGKVVAWADNATRAYGRISAKGGSRGGNGGFVETSGHWLDTSGIKVDASASKGKSGEWLLDPNDIMIQEKGTDTRVSGAPNWTTERDSGILTTASIQAALNNGTSVTVSTGTAGANSQQGNITVVSAINKTAGGDAALSLNAHNNININAPISSTAGKLDLTLTANTDGDGGGSTTLNRLVDLNLGKLSLHGESTISGLSTVKNATLLIPDFANSRLNGRLENVAAVNIAHGANLTINRGNPNFLGAFNNKGTLDINAFFVMNRLNLSGGTLTGRGDVKVNKIFNFHSGVLTGSGLFLTGEGSVTALADVGTAYLGRHWNNFGTINWQGAALSKHGDQDVVLNNMLRGVFNINSANATDVHKIDVTKFNNLGIVNVAGGILNVTSDGNDTGSYKVSGDGQLQFWYGARNFNRGAEVDSLNAVTFANGINNFRSGSVFNAAKTDVISFGTLNFNTGKAINLASLTIDTGGVGGADAVNINDTMALHSGSLNGNGLFTTAAGSTTTLADTGTVYLNKRWDNFGTLTWRGIADIVDNNKVAVFNNKAGGVFNIGGPRRPLDDVLELNTARFNNHGTLNLFGGRLKIVSPGTDTGRYNVSGNGLLQFWYGTRSFESGASVNSANTITFSNGKNFFRKGSSYSAQATEIISEARLDFSTGNLVKLSALTMDMGTLVGSDAVRVIGRFNFHSGVLGGSGVMTTGAGSLTALADKDTVYLGKHWDNLGTISWKGIAAIRNPDSSAVFNNLARGIFNISNADPTGILEITSARFNNLGKLNLSGGVLKIFSAGTDTGSYNVTDTGRLQFWNGTRNFNSGAMINSVNDVAFVNGKDSFSLGSGYKVRETLIDGARVTFSTGKEISLPQLAIDNSGVLNGSDAIEISEVFNFYSGFLGGVGRLTTLADSTTLLTEGVTLLNRDWNNYGTVSFGVPSATERAKSGVTDSNELAIKRWNNFGAILWQGATGATGTLGRNIVLTNKKSGFFNISSDDPSGVREVNIGGFFNQGTVNLFSGILKIISPGKDTGSYNVTGTGLLQFQDGARAFENGANVNSSNAVSFINSSNLFTNGALYNVPETVINGAKVSIDTPLSMGRLIMSDGILNNTGRLTINGPFDWSGGIVSGKGQFQFANGFNYTAGTMLATGEVRINDHSGNLLLPVMPLVKRLSASSSGDLILSGGIAASGNGTAITLSAGRRFDNGAGAVLSTPNGRWLIYSDSPSKNALGGLTADFKHYGCDGEGCKDGFIESSATGNGLLYAVTPVLSVTPDTLSSVYGDSVTFSSTYSGFIDGDNATAAGVSGRAQFESDAAHSSSGHANAGTHNVYYAGGLLNQLGYQFQDNNESTGEWLITPRGLGVTADAANKFFGDHPDPLFTYRSFGLLNGDTLSGALSRVAGEEVGKYAITQGNLTAGTNYQLKYTGADLSINPGDNNIPPETVQQQASDEQNQVLVLTKPDVFTLGNDNAEPGDEEITQKPLKQCQ